jgi:hypothetical protein
MNALAKGRQKARSLYYNMNRRDFLKFLKMVTVGAIVAYSFPSIIISKNIELIKEINENKSLTWPKLEAAFKRMQEQMYNEPDIIIVNRQYYNDLISKNPYLIHS